MNDMYAENSNDDYKRYKEVATQEDFDKFYSTGRFWSMNNL